MALAMIRLLTLVKRTKKKKINLPIEPRVPWLQDRAKKSERWARFIKEVPMVKTGGLAEVAVAKFLKDRGYTLTDWPSKFLARHDFDIEVKKDSTRYLVEVKGSNSKHLMVTKIERLLKLAEKEGALPCIAVYRIPSDSVYLFVLKEKGLVGQIRK